MIAWQVSKGGIQSYRGGLDVDAPRGAEWVRAHDSARRNLGDRHSDGWLAIYNGVFAKQDDLTGGRGGKGWHL